MNGRLNGKRLILCYLVIRELANMCQIGPAVYTTEF